MEPTITRCGILLLRAAASLAELQCQPLILLLDHASATPYLSPRIVSKLDTASSPLPFTSPVRQPVQQMSIGDWGRCFVLERRLGRQNQNPDQVAWDLRSWCSEGRPTSCLLGGCSFPLCCMAVPLPLLSSCQGPHAFLWPGHSTLFVFSSQPLFSALHSLPSRGLSRNFSKQTNASFP